MIITVNKIKCYNAELLEVETVPDYNLVGKEWGQVSDTETTVTLEIRDATVDDPPEPSDTE